MAFQYYVISGAGFNIRDAYNIHINSSYIRGDELDLDELFEVSNCTKDVIERQKDILLLIDEAKKVMKSVDEPRCGIGLKCKDPQECEYFSYCTKHLPENNVFNALSKRGVQM